jgi:hypothetical protein
MRMRALRVWQRTQHIDRDDWQLSKYFGPPFDTDLFTTRDTKHRGPEMTLAKNGCGQTPEPEGGGISIAQSLSRAQSRERLPGTANVL